MTYTDTYVYNGRLGQYMHIGLPGIVYKELDREEQIERMRKLVDPEMAEVLEKYDFVIEGIRRNELPVWMKCTAEEVRTFMESYPVEMTIKLPEDFLVRDMAKIYDILHEYDDESEYIGWTKDTIEAFSEPSDIAEHMKEDIGMLYPEVTVEIERIGDRYD